MTAATKDKFWVLYKEPACQELREALMTADRKAKQTYGYVTGVDHPATPAEHMKYTWGYDRTQRFDESGHRLVRPKVAAKSRSASPRRAA